jgi:tRNA threonylcarbamoyladenosine biosynthesis protein TsaB
MNYLAFDTSGTFLTVVAKRKEIVVSHIPECTRSHSIILMEEIEKSLEKAGVSVNEIDVFGCCIGPGSFTGIRIGVSTAKAFAYALSKKVLPVTSFMSLAYNISDDVNKLTIIDAKHDNFYVCGFNGSNEIILAPCFMSKESLLEKIDGFHVISDCEIEGINSTVGNLADGFKKAVEDNLERASYNVEELVPLYVKKSQVEEDLCL